MKQATDWATVVKPLIKKYKGQKHPLNYSNLYELIVMVILSARDSDKRINQAAPRLFEAYPNMKLLHRAKEKDLLKLLKGILNSANKTQWLMKVAEMVRDDKNIPLSIEGLTALPGIGRKSANVIMREAGAKPEGVIVDLHVLRVAPRLGMAMGTNPEKIEKQIMELIPQKSWGEIGMALSFLGRE